MSANLYDIYTITVCTVKTPDDGQRNCPKHVEFYSKNKFEKFVHLVGFIKRISTKSYHILHLPNIVTDLDVRVFTYSVFKSINKISLFCSFS